MNLRSGKGLPLLSVCGSALAEATTPRIPVLPNEDLVRFRSLLNLLQDEITRPPCNVCRGIHSGHTKQHQYEGEYQTIGQEAYPALPSNAVQYIGSCKPRNRTTECEPGELEQTAAHRRGCSLHYHLHTELQRQQASRVVQQALSFKQIDDALWHADLACDRSGGDSIGRRDYGTKQETQLPVKAGQPPLRARMR